MLRRIRTPAELVERLADGSFSEGHQLEAKRLLEAGPKSNLELARDLASLAVDGGVLVFGVDENKDTREFTPHPLPLRGLAERIESVAEDRVSPRLTVRCRELSYDDGTGFLIVEVPTSPEAPHMVDHVYYGRGDTKKTKLADAQVRRLAERRRQRQDEFAALLAADVGQDPTPDELREQAHLFILARPATGKAGMLHEALEAEGVPLRQWSQTAILQGPAGAALEWPARGWLSPDISPNMLSSATRARGVGHHTYEMGPTRIPQPNGERPPRERNLLDFEVDEDGTLHVFSTVSDWAGHRHEDRRRALIGPLPACLMVRAIRAAVAVSEATNYSGSWHLGMHITNLRGVIHSDAVNMSLRPMVAYTEDRYEAVGEFLIDELNTGEREIVQQLCGGLFRGLGNPLKP